MKCLVPEISWHNRDPVLSVDIQCGHDPSVVGNEECRTYRVATGGTDGHVEIWLVKELSDGTVNVECVSDLKRHNKAVNVVRFSPDGKFLASGDDESALFIWKKSDRGEDEPVEVPDPPGDEQLNRDRWVVHKTLRGHLEDIQDLCWSKDSNFLVSGSVDNAAIVWDVAKGQQVDILKEHKGFVQGVAYDPRGQYIATLSTDRDLRIYNMTGTGRRIVHKINRVSLKVLPEQIACVASGSERARAEEEEEDGGGVSGGGANPGAPQTKAGSGSIRLFHDDTLKTYSRRLEFSPDGELLFAPTGCLELNSSSVNAFYAFSRVNFAAPAVVYPLGSKTSALAVRCCPVLFRLRKLNNNISDDKDDGNVGEESKAPESLFALPYRMVFAVITQDSLILYDTQSALPFTKIANIHFTRLSDLSWSADGRLLMMSSTDGFCSFVTFAAGDLGDVYAPPAATSPSKSRPSREKPVEEEEAAAAEPVRVETAVGDGADVSEAAGARTSDGSGGGAAPTAEERPASVSASSGQVASKAPFVIRARSSKHGRRIEITTQPLDGVPEAKKCRLENADDGPTAAASSGPAPDVGTKTANGDEPGGDGARKSDASEAGDETGLKTTPKKRGISEDGDGVADGGGVGGGEAGSAARPPSDPRSAQRKRVPFKTLSSPKTYKKKPSS